MDMVEQVCTGCGECKQLANFHRRKSGQPVKRCKKCVYATQEQSRKASPEQTRRRARTEKLKREYGMSIDDYHKLLNVQNGVCAICGLPEGIVTNGVKNLLAVDHCHDTNKVRGLLCRRCNSAIGFLNDDAALLKKAIVYLEKHNDA